MILQPVGLQGPQPELSGDEEGRHSVPELVQSDLSDEGGPHDGPPSSPVAQPRLHARLVGDCLVAMGAVDLCLGQRTGLALLLGVKCL